MFSVFPICPSAIGNYRNWSIERRGAYFIFFVKGAALIKERRLFQLQVKQKGECREKVVGQEKGQICTPRTVIWTWFRKFPYIKTIELTSGCGSCLSSDMVLISFYIKSRNKGGAFICKLNWRCGAYSRAAFIREAALSWSFTVTSLFFVKQEKMKDFPLPSPPLRCFHMHWLNFPFITYYAYNRAFWRHLSLENSFVEEGLK